jgi:hypothetical protein
VWDESSAFDVAEYFGIKESLVNEVVSYCGVVGLFNKELLTRGSILSSLSIQKRYLEMCVRAKRTNFSIPENIKLKEESNIIPEESTKPPEECGQNSGGLPQSKVKESKEEESITTSSPAGEAPAPDLKKVYESIGKSKDEIREFIKIHKPDFIKPYVDLWNIFASERSLSQVKTVSDSRKKKFAVRIKETSFDFVTIIGKAAASDFLRTSKWFGFDWIIENDRNYLKVIEGNYDNSKPNKSPQQTPPITQTNLKFLNAEN